MTNPMTEAETKSAAPRVLGTASELEAPERYCTCCERPLKAKIAWLELDQRTDTYHDFGGVPAEKSQGWFPFGLTCARKENLAAIARAEEAQ